MNSYKVTPDWRSKLKMIYLGVIVSFSSTYTSFAQNSSFEFWPETDIWYRIDPSWRLSTFIPITKYHESKNRDLNIYLQADYAWGRTETLFYRRLVDDTKVQLMKAWLVRGGFMEGWSLGENSSDYTEDMLFGEIHRRVPLIGDVLISNRFRTDFRWVGQDPKFSYRFRYRVMVEKEYTAGILSIVPFMNVEPYWDSRYSALNRIRLIAGATLSWGTSVACEGNITYQYDSHYDSINMYALNLILHVFLEQGHDNNIELQN